MTYEELFTLTQKDLDKAKVNGFDRIIIICDTDDKFVISGSFKECIEAIASETDNEYNESDETKNEWFDIYEINAPELSEILEVEDGNFIN